MPVAVPYANLTNPQTLNLYSMVSNDPESFADLEGHGPEISSRWRNAQSSIGGECTDFWSCLKNSLVSDNEAGLGRQDPTDSSGAAGAAVGDFIATVQGAVEVVVGGTTQASGVAACGTGVGCLVTAPAVVAGTALEVHGGATAAEGFGHLLASALKSAEGTSSGGASEKPSLSDHKEALKQVHDKVGKLPKGEQGKFGSPQRGTPKKGYRLDPGHPNSPHAAERGPHINYWDYTAGKRGAGGTSGAVAIPPQE